MTPTPPTSPQPVDIIRAAQWLADRKGDQFGTIIPVVKERFGLTAVQAAEACTMAKRFRVVRRAFG